MLIYCSGAVYAYKKIDARQSSISLCGYSAHFRQRTQLLTSLERNQSSLQYFYIFIYTEKLIKFTGGSFLIAAVALGAHTAFGYQSFFPFPLSLSL